MLLFRICKQKSKAEHENIICFAKVFPDRKLHEQHRPTFIPHSKATCRENIKSNKEKAATVHRDNEYRA